MARIRVGSVGIGGISRGVHLPGIAASSDLELAAVCDIREEALQAAQQAYGIAPERCFRDYRDLIACKDVDVVDISTPNDVHFEVAMAAAKAGKSFCVEKPLTLTAEQADTLARAVEQAGVKTMVCFSYRYKAAARYARDL
ncbi:MAG: Gfo/Idh/MocA family oxidoreductase, partial [Clostridiales bacterium]|nr:Gfo/Idh/MocA family oxidoreductase [Clostridiales bacterium]